jgi:hypothetical protein
MKVEKATATMKTSAEGWFWDVDVTDQVQGLVQETLAKDVIRRAVSLAIGMPF